MLNRSISRVRHVAPGRVSVLDRDVDDLRRQVDDLRYALARSEAELRLKDALIHDIDHRTKNTLQIAAALLHMQGKRACGEVRMALSDAADRLVTVAAAHNRLNRLDADNRVRLDQYLAELCPALAGSGPDAPQVQISAEAISCRPEVAVPVGLLTSEAVMNALKHAFTDGRHGVIELRLTRVDGLVELVISDDGVGMDRSKPDGLGADLIRAFASQLSAQIERVSEPGDGCRIRLRFDPEGVERGRASLTKSNWV